MPGFNGTGPEGKGPRTGCGLGRCRVFASSKIGKTVFSIIIPAVGALVNDVRKPDSITRKLFASMKLKVLGTSRKHIEQSSEDRLISENKK